jgi:hypothetical protein
LITFCGKRVAAIDEGLPGERQRNLRSLSDGFLTATNGKLEDIVLPAAQIRTQRTCRRHRQNDLVRILEISSRNTSKNQPALLSFAVVIRRMERFPRHRDGRRAAELGLRLYHTFIHEIQYSMATKSFRQNESDAAGRLIAAT